MPVTATGTLLLSLEPVPSCPSPFDPQHITRPSRRTTQACLLPTAMRWPEATARSRVGLGLGDWAVGLGVGCSVGVALGVGVDVASALAAGPLRGMMV
jgi:hypothetical protein